MLVECCACVRDEVRLQLALPYLLTVLADAPAPSALRCAAVRAMASLVEQLRSLPPAEARVYQVG